MKLSDDWLRTALQVTGRFENSREPLCGVTGDFDGMGISLGVLQWNIGSGSLQPLVNSIGRAAAVASMPVYGVELWSACNSSMSSGLRIVRGWQTGATLRAPVKEELLNFVRSESFQAAQLITARHVGERALASAVQWTEKDPAFGSVTKHAFCWFFDLITQNGGLKGITIGDVSSFLAVSGVDRADDLVCDWLATRPAGEAGYRDSIKNAEDWRNVSSDGSLSLLILSYLRSQKSRPEYRGDTLNRKATIATGKGWVHRELHDVRKLLDM
jgi:hypothetical protein